MVDLENLGSESYNYLTELLEMYSQRVVRPANSPLKFSYFNGGLKDGSQAKINGKPLVVSLGDSFFNHALNTKVIREVEIDNPDTATGGTVKVAGLVQGEETLSQMIVNLALASGLSGGFEQSPSYARMKADGDFLKKQVESYKACIKSVSEGKSTSPCDQLSEAALPMAEVAVRFYEEAQAIALAQ